MGYVTKPYRIIYEARNFTTGLSNVQAFVLKPNLTSIGPFMLTELPSVFGGRYYFDLMTGPTDPTGEYIAAIFSPAEGIQTTHRVSLYDPPATEAELAAAVANISTAAQGGGIDINLEPQSTLSIKVENDSQITMEVFETSSLTLV